MQNSIKIVALVCLSSVLMLSPAANSQSEDNNADLNNIRGLVKPVTSATLSSEIMGRVIKLPFKLGDSFNKGQTLVKFDCSLHNAELAAAKAELQAEKKKHENNQQLLALNAISNIEVDISATTVEKAAAEKQIASVRVQRCTIRAPYDGRVIETSVHAHESVGPDQPLLSILNDKQLEIELIVPSNWLTWLQRGTPFRFTIDETGGDYQAKVSQLGASVDPVSQTIRVKGVFVSNTGNVLSGMSGTASFKTTGR